MAPSPDRAVLIRVPAAWAEVAGALLMDSLGAFEVQEQGELTGLLFYPERSAHPLPSRADILSLLPDTPELSSALTVEVVEVPSGWEENWRDFFVPFDIGRLHIRPPWEPVAGVPALDVCINPGLAFGTGFHPTTRGVLRLLAGEPVTAGRPSGEGGLGRLVDAGCGSGILSIAAFRLGYRPVLAFDADPLAVEAALENSSANGVEVRVVSAAVATADPAWFEGATVVANIAEKPVIELLDRMAMIPPEAGPLRLIAAGLLQGDQEAAVVKRATETGWKQAGLIREGEWVTIDFAR